MDVILYLIKLFNSFLQGNDEVHIVTLISSGDQIWSIGVLLSPL